MANQYSDRPQIQDETHLENRRMFVLECRRKSLIWDRVADAVEAKFGYPISPAQCAADFKIIMEKRSKEMENSVESMRAIMLDQLDTLLAKTMEKAEEGDLDAVDLSIKLWQRKSRLTGLDAPTKVEREDITPRLSREQMLERIEAIKLKLLGPRNDAPVNNAVDAVTVEVVGEQSSVLKFPDVPRSEQNDSSRSEPEDTE